MMQLPKSVLFTYNVAWETVKYQQVTEHTINIKLIEDDVFNHKGLVGIAIDRKISPASRLGPTISIENQTCAVRR